MKPKFDLGFLCKEVLRGKKEDGIVLNPVTSIGSIAIDIKKSTSKSTQETRRRIGNSVFCVLSNLGKCTREVIIIIIIIIII